MKNLTTLLGVILLTGLGFLNKENITTLTGDEAVTTLQSLNPVQYNYKADKNEKHVGFIAEEVPELVAMKDRKRSA
jgi:hypothetical protein